MSECNVSRRDVLRTAAAAALTSGTAAAQHEHHQKPAEAEKKPAGVYKPKAFTAHEWKTLGRLAELIVPAENGLPSALEARAPEYIDLLAGNNPDLAAIYTGGIAWLDRAMERRHGAAFVNARPEHQTAMLDLIAYRKNRTPELGPGIEFFDWVRRMVVDAYYTSPAGVKDVGFVGNKGMAKFDVPAEAIQYALKKSGLG